MSRHGQVKNRAPAPIQISAEQILREAADRQEQHIVEPIVKIHDAEEYQSHLQDRRKHFEDNIRYRREHIGNWVKYARFEEDNKEYERARSIFERALEVEHRSGELWLRYAEFEMRNEFLNHARNVLDRAVQILPRIDFLWYKFVYMEEMVQDIPKCRTVFHRWMKWKPDDNAWLSYARFETRNGNMTNAEDVMKQYVNTYPCSRSFLRFAKWAEFEAKDFALARKIFEAVFTDLEPEEYKQARVFKQFAAFEERRNEYDRARIIYKHAIQLLDLEGPGAAGKSNSDDVSDWELNKREELYKSYIKFEQKHGDSEGIQLSILKKQRQQYQERLQSNPRDYDGWIELAKLEEQHGHTQTVRDTYERAVANKPEIEEKEHWKRYIYLWIYYAMYEELNNNDLSRACEVYQTCLGTIPHSKFTFAKIWIYAAKCYVRQYDLQGARKLFGKAIGLCGKEKIFVAYIELELALGEIDRCRAIYNNYLKAMPQNCNAWSKYAALEKSIGEVDRCRAIFDLAVAQEVLDMPEMLWKLYIDFEIEQGEASNARKLYETLLQRTEHVKVWISYAQFEGTTGIGNGIQSARSIYEKAYDQLKSKQLVEDRVLLLDAWRNFEKSHGDTTSIQHVESKMPRRIKRKRMRQDDNGNDLGWEEYFDYQFPDDIDNTAEGGSQNLKILEMAAKWKQQQQDSSSDDDDSSDDDGDE